MNINFKTEIDPLIMKNLLFVMNSKKLLYMKRRINS